MYNEPALLMTILLLLHWMATRTPFSELLINNYETTVVIKQMITTTFQTRITFDSDAIDRTICNTNVLMMIWQPADSQFVGKENEMFIVFGSKRVSILCWNLWDRNGLDRSGLDCISMDRIGCDWIELYLIEPSNFEPHRLERIWSKYRFGSNQFQFVRFPDQSCPKRPNFEAKLPKNETFICKFKQFKQKSNLF